MTIVFLYFTFCVWTWLPRQHYNLTKLQKIPSRYTYRIIVWPFSQESYSKQSLNIWAKYPAEKLWQEMGLDWVLLIIMSVLYPVHLLINRLIWMMEAFKVIWITSFIFTPLVFTFPVLGRCCQGHYHSATTALPVPIKHIVGIWDSPWPPDERRTDSGVSPRVSLLFLLLAYVCTRHMCGSQIQIVTITKQVYYRQIYHCCEAQQVAQSYSCYANCAPNT